MAQIYLSSNNPNWYKEVACRADGVWFERIVSRLRDDKPTRWTKSSDQDPMGKPWHDFHATTKKARLPKD